MNERGGRPDPGSLDGLAAELRRHDRERFLATLFAPPAARPALWALLAFNLEIARIRETVSEPLLGRIRLQWWREAVDEIHAGGPVRRHQVTVLLAQAIAAHGISRAHLDAMIEGRERDLDDAPPATLAELEGYAEATSSRLLQAMLEALAVRDAAALEAVRHLGIAWALTGLIRAVPFHGAARRLYIPAEISRKAGLGEEAAFVGHGSPALAAALEAMADAARRHLAEMRRLRCRMPRDALPVLLIGRLAAAHLRRLARSGYDPHAAAVQQPDALAAARLAWGSWLGRC